VILNDANYQFKCVNAGAGCITGPSFLTVDYDDTPLPTGTGLVKITVHLDAYQNEFMNDTPKFCQPASYCAPNGNQCQCAPNTECTDNSVCAWSIKDLDCPLNGCFAFGITLPDNFMTGIAKPAAPGKFSQDQNYNWNLPFQMVGEGVAGKQCTY